MVRRPSPLAGLSGGFILEAKFTAPAIAIDSSGYRAAKGGFGRSDRPTGSVGASCSFSDHLEMSPRTDDHRNFRDPLFDTRAVALNATSSSLTLSGSY